MSVGNMDFLPIMNSRTVTSSLDVEDLLSKLNIDEKTALISGFDFWHTTPIPRLNIPSIRLSDGPNGVRGTKSFKVVPAACFPCGTALAATWDTDLIRKGGALQGDEAIAKGASVLLGPTINMQRSPLGGRGFESFSEDPFLAGAMGAATVQGIQSKGVSATIKHYVCNDQEHERMKCDSVVSERALREIYLMPFQIAQRDAAPWCYMTAYNRVNGLHASENPKLLQDILRGEWGFTGMVMSDWFGTYSTTESIKAGLDLEMPGPTYIRGKLVQQALLCGKLSPWDIDNRAREVLKLINKVQPLRIPENAEEKTLDTPETAHTLREIAAASIVLLKNERNVLPFNKEKTIAVIGPNTKVAAYCGGGSASLKPYYAITPFEGIAAQAKNVTYSVGCSGHKKPPLLSRGRLIKTKDGRPGMTMRVYLEPASNPNRSPIDTVYLDSTEIFLMDYKHPALTSTTWYSEIEGEMTLEASGEYIFSLSVAGTAILYVDGKMVVDNEKDQTRGDSFFGLGTGERTGVVKLEKGPTCTVLIKHGTLPTSALRVPGAIALSAGGLRIGGMKKIDDQTELEKAVKIAKTVDQVVICAGLNSDWESEGYDRTCMSLPGLTSQLISSVLAANPNTAVVLQSGTPVTLTPWLSSCPALLQAWYGGNETGNAIADILFGDRNPSAKLPLTFPLRGEDNPAYLNYRSEAAKVLYGEGVYIGYRFYEKIGREVAFPFGHGLSYTTFAFQNLSITEPSETDSEDDDLTVSVSVRNTGALPGAEVVQVYIAQQNPSISRPVKELKGFQKVNLGVGQEKRVDVRLSRKYAASFWDETRDAWVMERDRYEVLVGGGSGVGLGDGDAAGGLRGVFFAVRTTRWWRGL